MVNLSKILDWAIIPGGASYQLSQIFEKDSIDNKDKWSRAYKKGLYTTTGLIDSVKLVGELYLIKSITDFLF